MAVFLQNDGIVVRTDVHKAHLVQFALRHRRTRLTFKQQQRVVAQLHDVKAGTYHLQAAEIPLLLATDAQLARLVEHQFTRHLAVCLLKVLYITYYVTALMHVQQHWVTLVLLHVQATRQHTRTVRVQTVIRDSHTSLFHFLQLC